ncbi:MAG: thioredoxin family protein [Armatimonadetes bacterium]|nr:thioredoxin family protein [Armatimonadota bacterium]
MKQFVCALITVAVLGRVAGAAPLASSIKWEKSYEEALKLSTQTGKLVMVDFYGEWCPACKEMDRATYTNREVLAESRNWINLKIDVDKNPKLSEKYSTPYLPTILFLNAQGDEVKRNEGFLDPVAFLDFAKEAHKTEKDLREALETLAQNPEDLEANYKLALVSYARKNFKRGQEHMEKVLALDPQNSKGYGPELFMRSGLAHGMNRDFKKAIELFGRGVKDYPDSSVFDETRYYLALSYQFDGQLSKAKEVLAQVVATAKVDKIKKSATERLAKLSAGD